MPSTYSPSLRLELIGNGEQAGTWGTTTNNNLGSLLEQAITGVQPITLTGGDITLTDYNGLPDQARNAVLMFNGLLSAPCNVIAPSSEKVYVVRNRANATVTIKTATGNGIAIANAASEVIFCDGTDFYSATQFNYIDGTLTVSGNLLVGGNTTITGKTTLVSDVYGNVNTGQWYLPTGTTAQRNNASPVNGLVRFNTDGGGFFEGYANGTWVKFSTFPEGNYDIKYLIIAGGGGATSGAGAGAGGLLTGTITSVPGTLYTITIGGGGAGGGTGYNGSQSVISGIVTCVGGGTTGTAGGSGGGGNGAFEGGPTTGYPGAQGTIGQGYNGGKGGDHQAGYVSSGGGGGGGGAGGLGGDGQASSGGTNGNGGSGGIGYASSISGAITYYGGGGGGGSAGSGGAGGSGGGGNGGGSFVAGTAGQSNTGSGGGGGGYGANGANGGSGLCILSIPTVNYTGTTTGSPLVSIVGPNTVLTYTISGTYTS